ncbi:hypothetical protein N7532_000292 [Penicillium argentinense]|uniref:Uncharacterized protein n=1 Tax=Penicillium argentinense TaxID=1131581 RepID=A0A9W9KNP7_9EURO|nr:uncharacterized protein N7532_000292 [Penicillium argentinense]KAJ5112247.1 hypothetical protein N7532_000292 [Penicillium argentinense]
MLQPLIDSSLVTTATLPHPWLVVNYLRKKNPSIVFIQLQWVNYSGVPSASVHVLEEYLVTLRHGEYITCPAGIPLRHEPHALPSCRSNLRQLANSRLVIRYSERQSKPYDSDV